MTEPLYEAEWATADVVLPDGTPNKIRPDPPIRSNGYAPEQYPTAQELNWQFNNLYQQILYLKSQVATPSEKKVGELVFITGDTRNPSVIYGYGTWQPYGGGRVVVGVGTYTDESGNTLSFADGQTGGEYLHKLTPSEMPIHSHPNGVSGPSSGPAYKIEGYTSAAPNNDNYRVDSTGNVGGDQSHNNTQPYIACFIWRRVS